MSNLSFLFGSGISIPAELPSTTYITEYVLNGKDIHRHSDETYYIDSGYKPMIADPNQYVLRNQIFLNRLKIEAELFYLLWNDKYVNYEDIYYLAAQIHDCETGEVDNPAVKPFIDKILPDIKALLKESRPTTERDWPLSQLAKESVNYIRDIVWHLLLKKPAKTDYLQFMINLINDSRYEKIDFFTLNHDTLLEQIFYQEKIEVCDGFGDYENDVKYWQPDLYNSSATKVKLLKLHGSVNWFRLRKDDGDWRDDKIGIPKNLDFWHTKDPYDNHQFPPDGRPFFLAGTYNKMMQYISGIYMDIHSLFHNRLPLSNHMIISGYSFSDKGINSRIIEWLYSNMEQNRILVIDPDPESLKKTARGSVSNKWDKWVTEGVLKTVSKPIQDVVITDINFE